MSKNTAVFGIYPSYANVESGVDGLKAAGFSNRDISVLFPESAGEHDDVGSDLCCRQIFDLREVEGYQHHEIAELLQCSIGNSKSQLHKAKLKMREMLFPKEKCPRWQKRSTPVETTTCV